MSHELGTHESWLAVMHDLCRWTSKERQRELAHNSLRIERERREMAITRTPGNDTRRQWNAIRSVSRRGVVRGVEERRDFSWASVEAAERRYESKYRPAEDVDDYIDMLVEDINRQSQTAGK